MSGTLSTLILNLHAGQLARRTVRRRYRPATSPLKVLLAAHKPDVAVLPECRDLAAVRRESRGYIVCPGTLWDGEVVAVLMRRKTFLGVGRGRMNLSERRDSMHPARRLLIGDGWHRTANVRVSVYGVHLWAMGDGWSSPDAVVAEHVSQCRRIAELAAKDGTVVLLAGDWNENLNDLNTHGDRAATSILRKSGFRFSAHVTRQQGATSLHGKSLLDDVAYRPSQLELVARRTLSSPGHGADHRPVLTVHRIKEKP